MSDPLTPPSREPTAGELRIMFTHIMDALKEVKDTMATKEFVNTKFESSNDRIARVESDVKEWIEKSTAAHVELDKDSKARHAESRNELDSLEARQESKIKAIKDQQAEDQKELRQVRSARINILLVAVLGVLGNLVVLYITTGGFRAT